MSDASTSALSTPNLGDRLRQPGLIPALAHAAIAVIVCGLCLIAANGDAVGYRNVAVLVLQHPAQVRELYAGRAEGLELRPSLDLL